MERNYQVNNVVYKCEKKCTKIYLGLAKGEWKSRFYNYKLSCKHKKCSNKTAIQKKHLT